MSVVDLGPVLWRRAGDGARVDPLAVDGVGLLWLPQGWRDRISLSGAIDEDELAVLRFASGKSNYLISKDENAFWNAASYTPPATLYFGLWTSALTAASTGSTAGETAYTSYVRLAVTANTTNFPTSSSGAAINNGTAITWAANTGSVSTITYIAVDDASSAGNLTYWGSITSTAINAGDTPQININGLTATEA